MDQDHIGWFNSCHNCSGTTLIEIAVLNMGVAQADFRAKCNHISNIYLCLTEKEEIQKHSKTTIINHLYQNKQSNYIVYLFTLMDAVCLDHIT